MLGKEIDSAGLKASYDAACKKLLANKVILAWIMKSCLEEYRNCSVQDIAERYIEGEPQIAQTAVHPDEGAELIRGASTEDSTIHEGTVTYDIRFYALAPVSGELISLIINVEAQNDFYPGYPVIKRGIYYGSRMISSQYGKEFTESHYEKIKKVYSLWICMDPPEYRKNTINRYSIQEECLAGNVKENPANYDLLTAVMICLGDTGKETQTSILKLLEVLLSSDREADEKKRILQEEFAIRMTRALESEVSVMCNLSKGVEEKGIARGVVQGVLFSIRKLMESTKWTEEQAMDALQIPEADREKYREELKK